MSSAAFEMAFLGSGCGGASGVSRLSGCRVVGTSVCVTTQRVMRSSRCGGSGCAHAFAEMRKQQQRPRFTSSFLSSSSSSLPSSPLLFAREMELNRARGKMSSQIAMVATEPSRTTSSTTAVATDINESNSVSPSFSPSSATRGLPVTAPASAEISMLYDGECHLCLKEVNFLQRKDADNGKIHFVDISADDYDPAVYHDISYELAMGRIHAITTNGDIITGVQVFRKLYELIGLGHLYAITKNPIIGALAEKVYNVWADNRLRMTGRGELADVIKERDERIRAKQLASGGADDCEESCKIEW